MSKLGKRKPNYGLSESKHIDPAAGFYGFREISRQMLRLMWEIQKCLLSICIYGFKKLLSGTELFIFN